MANSIKTVEPYFAVLFVVIYVAFFTFSCVVIAEEIEIPFSISQNLRYFIIAYFLLALIWIPLVCSGKAPILFMEKRDVSKLKWIFWLMSIGGAIVAIWYTKTGTFISVVGAVEERSLEKVENYLEKKRREKEREEKNNELELQTQNSHASRSTVEEIEDNEDKISISEL